MGVVRDLRRILFSTVDVTDHRCLGEKVASVMDHKVSLSLSTGGLATALPSRDCERTDDIS